MYCKKATYSPSAMLFLTWKEVKWNLQQILLHQFVGVIFEEEKLQWHHMAHNII